MAENILLPSYTGTTALTNLGVYALSILTTEEMFLAWQDVINDNVFVEFDGNTYECAPQRLAAMDNAVAVGNCANFGGTGNGEPFIVTIMPDTDMNGNATGEYYWAVAALTDTEPTEHTVEVYQVEASTAFAVVLKDRSGADVTYEVPSEQIKLNTPNGTQIFTAGQAVENVPITLDLADGDQTVNAPDGTLVKSAIIQKPSTLTPDNIVKDVNIAGVVGAFEGGGSSENYEGAIIDRTISGYYFNSTATKIGTYAFYSCVNLTGVECTQATRVDASAFYGCTNLTSISLPNCTYFGSISSCSKITSVYAPLVETIEYRTFGSTAISIADFPNCTSVSTYTFYSCVSLTYANLPKISVAGSCMFQTCKNLESVNMPSLTYVDNQAFSACYKLSSINTSLLSYISPGGFAYCSGLTELTFSNRITIGNSAFRACTGLSTVQFMSDCKLSGANIFGYCYNLSTVKFMSDCEFSGAYVFSGCSKLRSVYFYGTNIPSTNTNMNAVFLYCPIMTSSYFGGEYGSIFVPASLVDSYKVASYWSTVSSRITAIPESEE